MNNKGQELKAYLAKHPQARVKVQWHSVSKAEIVTTVYQVTEVCERCFFGRAISGEPSSSKPFWAVMDWKAEQ